MNWSPLYISLKVALYSTILAVVTGIPLCWLLTQKGFKGKNFIASLVTLPLVLPPTVIGYYLLILIGRQSAIGSFLYNYFGISLIFTIQGAILASYIVSLPLFVKTLLGGLEGIDKSLQDVARTLGKNELQVLLTIALPLAKGSLTAGTALSFARAMGEFGATLMVAGNIPGKTQTLSIAIYAAVQSGKTDLANMLVIVISILTLGLLYILNVTSDNRSW
jgi:molybdate transport system permease protein